MTLRLACLLLLVLSTTRPTPAGDDIQAVTAVWADFAAALRRGDYRNAHGLFSAESRAALPYAEFVREYAPLSAAREMVVARQESLSTRVDGDWAVLAYGGHSPTTGRRFRVDVALVRNGGRWGVVAARNEAVERLEAEARTFLRLLADRRPDRAALQ
ncbi:MAG: nuclear transport factor 2 family protein, partial [Planctomycetes bacterium]|nr:nuclear transport factor 2 family protein [Planctomycetota bacterium]